MEKKFYLKQSVRDDLIYLHRQISLVLARDAEGFIYPSTYLVPTLFRFCSRYLWCKTQASLFKSKK